MKYQKNVVIAFLFGFSLFKVAWAAESIFEGKLGEKSESYTYGSKFNDFMMAAKKNDVIKLKVSFDDFQKLDFEEGLEQPDDLNRIVFTDADFTMWVGVEYLIHLSKSKKKRHFEYSKDTGTLSGCFLYTALAGPHQGIMSINLKPVKCSLKK